MPKSNKKKTIRKKTMRKRFKTPFNQTEHEDSKYCKQRVKNQKKGLGFRPDFIVNLLLKAKGLNKLSKKKQSLKEPSFVSPGAKRCKERVENEKKGKGFITNDMLKKKKKVN